MQHLDECTTSAGANCRTLSDACAAPREGETCQTVYWQSDADCNESCTYAGDSLLCSKITPFCQSDPPKATSLFSSQTQSANSNFGTSANACVIDPKAVFIDIPNYDQLIATYYNKSNLTKSPITSMPNTLSANGLYKVDGDLNIDANPSGSGTQIFFVEGNLNINTNYTFGSTFDSGTVFVVKKDVNIAPSVTQINAVIVSEGTIYTAGANCQTNNEPASQLIINGSLIAITDTIPSPIRFCRKLANNTEAAEK